MAVSGRKELAWLDRIGQGTLGWSDGTLGQDSHGSAGSDSMATVRPIKVASPGSGGTARDRGDKNGRAWAGIIAA